MSNLMEIKPGSTYLLRTEETLTADMAERILEVWSENAPDSRLVIIDRGLEVTELTDEQIAACGLART